MVAKKKETRQGIIVDKVIHIESHVSYPLFEDSKTRERYVIGDDYDPEKFVSYAEFMKGK